MQTEYAFIRFEEASRSDAKTKLWACKNRKANSLLGAVEWYSPWRQYIFMSAPDCVFSESCLKDIADFLKQANISRRSAGSEPLQMTTACR